MRRALCLAVALLAASCSPSVQPQTPSPQPAHGAVARVELSSNPGTGSTGGTAAITARVLDAYGALLANQAVTFATSVGTFTEASALTNEQGIARTTLNAPAGNAMVTARAGEIQTTPLQVAVQPLVTPPPPTPNPPTPHPEPNPSPQPTGPLTVTLQFTPGLAGSPTSFSLAMQGGLSSAQWSFGDNTAPLTTSLVTAVHVYASPGTYVAGVTVRDQGGRTASDTKAITISAAPTPPTPQPAYTSVTMTASPTTTTAGGSITYSAAVIAVNGAPAPSSYAWDCNGDGVLDFRTTLSSQSCTYAAAGSFIATVVANNGEISAMGSRSVIITPAPVPSYSVTLAASQTSVSTGGSSTLTATVTPVNGAPMPPTTFDWDCDGNGTFEIPGGTNPQTCVYPTNGSIVSRVRVSTGAATGTATATVTVSAPPTPVISVSCSTVTFPAASSCVVSATLSGVPVTSSSITITAWDWGDGAAGLTGTGAGFVNQSHPYAAASGAGGYTVIVSATVPGGGGAGTGSGKAIVN